MKKISERKKAYSLIELSIVIVIMSIIISSGLSLATSSSNNTRIQLTKERMNVVYKAIGAYLINHRSLPCPAPINASRSSDTNYGDSSGVDGTCTTAGVLTRGTGLVYGMIPTQDLGLDSSFAEDGFGSKFTYVVAQAFTNPDLATGFATATPTGIITVKDKIDPSTEQITTSDAIFVLISHGVNKFGAYSNNSATANAASSDLEEQSNYGNTNIFYANSNTSDIFDDILLFKNRDDIASEFDALDLIACKGTPNGDQTLTSSDGLLHTWPLTKYNQIAPSLEDCGSGWKARNARPLKRCGAFGVWESDPSLDCRNS